MYCIAIEGAKLGYNFFYVRDALIFVVTYICEM